MSKQTTPLNVYHNHSQCVSKIKQATESSIYSPGILLLSCVIVFPAIMSVMQNKSITSSIVAVIPLNQCEGPPTADLTSEIATPLSAHLTKQILLIRVLGPQFQAKPIFYLLCQEHGHVLQHSTQASVKQIPFIRSRDNPECTYTTTNVKAWREITPP